MHKLYELKDKLVKQLEKDAEDKLTSENLKEIDTLAHAAKNLCKVIESCEDEEYSGRYYEPDYGASYAPRRDSMGRFSRDDMSRDRMSREDDREMSRGMSRDGMNRTGYARDNSAVEQLEQLMAHAADDRTRGKFRELIREMRNA